MSDSSGSDWSESGSTDTGYTDTGYTDPGWTDAGSSDPVYSDSGKVEAPFGDSPFTTDYDYGVGGYGSGDDGASGPPADHQIPLGFTLHVAGELFASRIKVSSFPVFVAVTLIELTIEGMVEATEEHEEQLRQRYEMLTETARAGLVAAQYVAGCDGDHNGTSWSGGYRDTYEEAYDDLQRHIYEWPDHTQDDESGTGEGGVQEF
jgi:hypothetical protein